MRNVGERIGGLPESLLRLSESRERDFRSASIGIIKEFDSTTQSVSVQLAIREPIKQQDGSIQYKAVDILLDCPIVLPCAGGFSLELPIAVGDECLVIFADSCIDSWYTNGGIQNPADDTRRHSLSDGIAIIGIRSIPRASQNYSTDSARLTNDDGTQYIEIKQDGINIVGNVKINGISI